MEVLEFGPQREKIKTLLDEFESLRLTAPPIKNQAVNLEDMVRGPLSILEKEGTLRVSLLGEFSAGKSSLIKALTGIDVPIGAGVTTQDVTSYKWMSVELVDTPGVHGDSHRTDHDEIADRATKDADLILFMVTNELLDTRLAGYFRYVAKELGLAKKTMIVVNKMDRENAADEVIISEVQAAIDDLEIPIILVAIDRYLSLNEKKRESSRIPEAIKQINAFIAERGALGRLTRPLQVFEEKLDATRSTLAGNDAQVINALELNRRQVRALTDAERRLDALMHEWRTRMRQIVHSQTVTFLDRITDNLKAEELESMFMEAFQTVEPEIDAYFGEIQSDLSHWRAQLEEAIEEIEDSELGTSVRELHARNIAKGEYSDAPRRGFDFAMASKSLLNEAGGVLADVAADPKAMKEFVKVAGKKMGKSFRPWEATKLGKKIADGVGKGAKVLGPLTVALDFYMNYREEKERDEKAKFLAQTRLTFQRQFNDLAKAQLEALDSVIGEIRRDTIGRLRMRLEEQSAAIAHEESSEKEWVEFCGQFIARSRILRAELLNMPNPDGENTSEDGAFA